MREFLDDAHQHRQDGVGRAQAQLRRDLPKRFYEMTGVKAVEGGYAITLDDRPTKTPGRLPVVVPNEDLAAAMASEWAAQHEVIDPHTMPLVRLVNSAIEGGADSVPGLRDEIVKYAANDLLLYRADSPRELAEAQETHWDRALVRLARHFDVSFQPTIGIVHQPQPERTLARLAESLGDGSLLELAALVSITALTGSGLLAIAIRHRLLTADEAWVAAHVDEDHNIRLWGAVDEATERRAKRRLEFDAAVRLLALAAP